MLMLPDGAETQLDDWTMFFLNQRPFNAISPVLALETSNGVTPDEWREKEGQQDLLCVLNLVRTKHDKNEKRYDTLTSCSSSIEPFAYCP